VSRLSENRISHLAHLVLEALRRNQLAEFSNERYALAETKQVLNEFFRGEDPFDEAARRKILSLSRHVPPGSREWEILYRKYYEEEVRKQRK
jgi:hypothetical protein